MQATWVQSLGQEDPLDKGTAPTPVFLPGEFHGQRTRWATVREIAQSRTPLCDRLPLFLSSGEKRNARSRGVWKSEPVLTIPDPGGGSATGGNQAHFREEPPRAPPPPALVSSASITEGMVGRWGPLPSAPLVSRSAGHWPGVTWPVKLGASPCRHLAPCTPPRLEHRPLTCTLGFPRRTMTSSTRPSRDRNTGSR